MAKDKFATSELNFTYFLGAGASAEVLPIINNMSSWFMLLAKILKENKNIDIKYDDIKNSYIANLEEMAEQSAIFGTIDTYIKFLFLKDRTKCDEIKNVLSFFFFYYQAFTKNRDKRALIFLTSVMQHDKIFPSNINFITWNYDFQIELASEVFTQEKLFRYANGFSHSPPLISYYPTPSLYSEDLVQIVHLNGIAGMYENGKGNRYSYFLNPPEDINKLFEIFSKEYNSSLISFAWEQEYQMQRMEGKFKFANSIMKNTDILIVIGYSFPYFNRIIDDLMFKTLLENGRFKKIYFQNPNLDGSFLRNQFNIKNEIEITHIQEKDNYYIPKEL